MANNALGGEGSQAQCTSVSFATERVGGSQGKAPVHWTSRDRSSGEWTDDGFAVSDFQERVGKGKRSSTLG